nr:MAG TPA: hypothetical protein [Caudoviricetes sp.]
MPTFCPPWANHEKTRICIMQHKMARTICV